MKVHHIPSPATVMSAIALVTSLGTGGAYAATQLKPNSVGSAQIKPGAVRLSDLAPEARPGAVVQGATGPAGPVGAQGIAGPIGPAGEQGPAGLAGVVIRDGLLDVGPGSTGVANVGCANGERALGGGGRLELPGVAYSYDSTVRTSYPINRSAWVVSLTNTSATAGVIHAYVVCARVAA